MLNLFFELLAPSTFTKGIYRYEQKDYQNASRLLKRAAKWMPDLQNDGLFYAYQFLVDYHLGEQKAVEDIDRAVDKLSQSSYKSQNSYSKAEAELKNMLIGKNGEC